MAFFAFFLGLFLSSKILETHCSGAKQFQSHQGKGAKGFLLFGQGNKSLYLSTTDGILIRHWAFAGGDRIIDAILNPGSGELSLAFDFKSRAPNLSNLPADRIVWTDFEGKQLRSVTGLAAHHWMEEMPNGNLLAPNNLPTLDKKSSPPIVHSEIIEIQSTGIKKRWPTQQLGSQLAADPKSPDPLHLNRVKYYPSNPITGKPILLVSLRNTDTIAMLDYESGTMIWQVSGLVRRQHDPTLLKNGNILVFDNGFDYQPVPYSKIVEIDPRTNKIVKSFQAAKRDIGLRANFYSPYAGFALVTEKDEVIAVNSKDGSFFALSKELEKVLWSNRNPYRTPSTEPGLEHTHEIKFMRYLEDGLLDTLPWGFLDRWRVKATISTCRILLS